MISYIFNLFSETLHWIFKILFHWNLIHYLNDFLFIFKSQIDLSSIMSHYNEILTEIDLIIILKKNMNDIIIIHLKFEFNSLKMKIHLSHNKYSYILYIITDLLKAKFIIYSILNKILNFLSHCYQIILLKYSFLHNIFFTLHHIPSSYSFHIYLSHTIKKNLQWWFTFLFFWFMISVIQLSCINHDIIIDISEKKEIDDIYNKQLFFDYILIYHRQKYINWKEIFAIFHAFILWHE